MIVAAITALAVCVLLLSRSYTLMVGLLVLAGFCQAILMTLTHDSGFQYVDDVVAGGLIAAALSIALMTPVSSRPAVLYGGLVALSGLAVVRSPELGVGLTQARQVLEPVGIVVAGYVLRDRINWASVLRWVAFLASVAAVWAIVEKIREAPVLDPVYYYLTTTGSDLLTLRFGLPGAYFSDTGTGTIFRAGGPFMNPPTLGFFLAAGAVGAVLLGIHTGRGLRWVVVPLVGVALVYAAYARAGMVIAAMTTVVAYTWGRFGKFVTVVAGGAVGLFAAQQFMQQGNTASHGAGFISGLQAAVTSGVGLGFGSTGYQAALTSGEANSGSGTESLLGLYAAWLGLPVVLLLLWTVRRLVQLLRAGVLPRAQVWAALGMLVAAALSETASAVAATPTLWLLIGVTLAGHAMVQTPEPTPARMRPVAVTPRSPGRP